MIKKNPTQTTNTACLPLQFDTASWFAPELTKLAEHLNDQMVEMMRYYPEPDYKTLRTMIAKRNGLHADNIVITPGRTASTRLRRLLRGGVVLSWCLRISTMS